MKAKLFFLAAFFLTRGLCASEVDLSKSWAVVPSASGDAQQQFGANSNNMQKLAALQQQLDASEKQAQEHAANNFVLRRKLAAAEKERDIFSDFFRKQTAEIKEQDTALSLLETRRKARERRIFFVALGLGYFAHAATTLYSRLFQDA